MLRAICLALLVCAGVFAAPTPPPSATPPTPAPKESVNPALVGKCCGPGRCNTRYLLPGATSIEDSCSIYKNAEGKTAHPAYFKPGLCDSASACATPTNYCGGYDPSGKNNIPGEWCTAQSVGQQCCIPGKCGTDDCAKGTTAQNTPFDSSDWLVCKFQKGCEDVGNQCGGTGKAGQWCVVGKKEPPPSPSPGGSGGGSGSGSGSGSKKSGGGLSGGAIAGIVIAGLIVVGIAGFMFNRQAEPENDYYHKAADGTYAPPSAEDQGSATVEHDRL